MTDFSESAHHFGFNYALPGYGTDVAETFGMWCGKFMPGFDPAEASSAATDFGALFDRWCDEIGERPNRLLPEGQGA